MASLSQSLSDAFDRSGQIGSIFSRNFPDKIFQERGRIHTNNNRDNQIMWLSLEISTERRITMAEGMKFWVMSWGSHALVLEPESLRNEIRAEAEAMLNRYEGTAEAERVG